MVPNKDGHANHGHSCVKGRFAFGYATHPDRILKPMIRAKISDPWREVSWDEAISHAAAEFKRIQAKYGRDSIGGITSSRCTNEETYLVQKLVRAGFGNNNVDTCARVCHSPTGYGLKNTLGESAGTQNFDSVMKADVIMVIGANPTDGHPVFASQMKRRLREGREADRRRSAPHRSGAHAAHQGRLSPAAAARHQRRADQCAGARHRHRESRRRGFRARSAARSNRSTNGASSSPKSATRPKRWRAPPACPPPTCARRRGCTRPAATARSTTASASPSIQQGTTMVMGIANLAMATGNIGREGVGVNPLRGQNNVQGSCDMGSFPHEFTAIATCPTTRCARVFEKAWGVHAARRARPAHPEHVRGRARRQLQGALHRRRGHRAVRSEHAARDRGADRDGMHRRAGSLSQRDRRSSRTCSCRARRSSRRTARSPTPNAASRACARSCRRRTATRTGKSRSCCPTRSAIR